VLESWQFHRNCGTTSLIFKSSLDLYCDTYSTGSSRTESHLLPCVRPSIQCIFVIVLAGHSKALQRSTCPKLGGQPLQGLAFAHMLCPLHTMRLEINKNINGSIVKIVVSS